MQFTGVREGCNLGEKLGQQATLMRGTFFVSVLAQDEGYTVKYNPLPQRVPKGGAQYSVQ